jgi:hypothetical protein
VRQLASSPRNVQWHRRRNGFAASSFPRSVARAIPQNH